MELPRFVVFQSTGKYLSVTENIPASIPSGFVKFDETNIWNPRVKFALEQAQTGDGDLVHIRSCYNNKYLVSQLVSVSNWLVASSKKPEEDQSNLKCTLFRVEPSSPGERTIRIRLTHIQTQIPVYHYCIDRSEDGRYHCSRVVDHSNQRFESGFDLGDPLVAKQLFPTPDGYYRIRDLHFGKFWRCSPNWIWADAEEDDHSKQTLFSVVRVSDNVIALRNLGNNYFCASVTEEGKTDCLNANSPTISKQTRLILEERILEREISDIRYRLSDSIVSEEEIQEVSHSFATNNSSEESATISLHYSTGNTRTTRWTNSVSVKGSLSVKFKTTIIPFIAQSEVEAKAELGYEHVWDDSITDTVTRDSTYVVVVPPLTTMKVTLMCTKGSCEVPYYYTQRDLLDTGERVTTIKDDGIYTGSNSFDFYFDSTEVRKDAKGRIYLGR